jgi:tetratricopeptide (TPR) repeat protein
MTGPGAWDGTAPGRQEVSATGGFAYGVIGADIHVFGDGTPLYLLENWRTAPQTDAAWLRELPSRMLNARYAVVEFTGRRDALEQLRRWRQDGPRLAARWLHGPSGTGKTRLAAQFAVESAAAGWKVVTATHGPGTVLPPPGSQDLRLDGAAGLLMIVDYADRWPLSHLTWLFSNAVLHQIGVPTRILLLARTADAWPGVRATLANHQAATTGQVLEPLPGGGHRVDMFTAARDSFATRYQIDDPGAVEPPGPLDDPDMGLTLAVHMAALVAVDAHLTGGHPPTDMAGLTIYLLDREHLHWANLYGDPSHNLDPTPAYRTPPQVMNQAVFTAALTGPVTRPAGTTILNQLPLRSDPRQVLTDHAVCYPPAAPTQGTVLEPLYPDRLAEDFLALTMPGHCADYPTQPWAAATATTLLTRSRDHHAPPAPVSRSITFLAAATQRWPHLGRTYLYPLLRRDPQLTIDAGGAALSTLAAISDVDIGLLEAIEALLPTDRHVDLDIAAAAITARLTTHRLATTTDPAQRADLHANLAWRLAHAGRREEALDSTEEAVAIRRRLAEANPAAHLPGLAAALHNLGVGLSEVGRREQALAPTEEAVAIRRRLAEANPAAHLPDLAIALNNLGNRLSEVGRREQALAPTEEAVAIHRRLAEANPAAYLPELARGLWGFAWVRAAGGIELRKALSAVQEAIGMYQPLATRQPEVFGPDLWSTRHTLADVLDGLGRSGEAAALRRRLAAEPIDGMT